MRGSLAESPELVNEFLNGISKEIKTDVMEEFQAMRELKNRQNSNRVSGLLSIFVIKALCMMGIILAGCDSERRG